MMAKKKSSILMWIILVLLAVILVVAVVVVLRFRNAREAFAARDYETAVLTKGEIVNSLSVSGQVDSENVVNVYAQLTGYPVQTVLVQPGGRVQHGDILATLDATNLAHDITQAENNLANTVKALAAEVDSARSSYDSALLSYDRQKLTLDKNRADLAEAQAEMNTPFDTYSYDLTIRDAALALARKEAELEDAAAKLDAAESAFDGYNQRNAVADATLSLARKQNDLAMAEAALDDAQNRFDDYSYQNTIADAKTSLERKQSDLDKLEEQRLPETDDRWITADNAVKDAQKNYDKAVTDLARAQTKAIEDAEKSLTTAQTAVADADRALAKAETDLTRAQDDAVKAARDTAASAQRAVDDARRTWEKAENDLVRAMEKAAADNAKALAAAKRNVTDAEKSLESNALSLASAESKLAEAEAKTPETDTTVIDRRIALDKLLDQRGKAVITAPADGVITAVNATAGTNPSGVLFVIEDTELLYVTARVKEYDLGGIAIGQTVRVTTDATNDTVFPAEIIYISPKAVSDAGATNVEFEIHAAIHTPDEHIKIGMNAFLAIIMEEKQDVFAVPLTALVTDAQGSFLRVEDNGAVTEISVTVGMQSSVSAEITGAALHEGMIFVTTAPGAARPQTAMPAGMFGGGW